MKIEINFPVPKLLRGWWNSRTSRVRGLERQLAAMSTQLQRREGGTKGVREAGEYWARRASTEITWAVVLWHIRQRTIDKLCAAGIPWAKARTHEPTEEEALEVLRDMLRDPPAFAPPDAARAAALELVSTHTKRVA